MYKSIKKLIGFLLITSSSYVEAQIYVYDSFDAFESMFLIDLDQDTTYVINFWATWCSPCIKELPYFEELNNKYSSKAFRQVLVSLDDPEKIESALTPFLKNKNIQSQVVVLADSKAHKWIDKIDPSWSGAIPITIILRGDKKLFYEREFHNFEELQKEVLLLYDKN